MKRILSVMLVVLMLFTTITVNPVMAEENKETDNSYIQLLYDLKIIDKVYVEEDSFTNGDFVKAVARLTGFSENDLSGDINLSVNGIVPGDTVLYYMNHLITNGIMDQVEEFNSDTPVTLDFAAKTLCNALGYKELARVKGSYYSLPVYRTVCSGFKLGTLTPYSAVKMLYNAMNTNMMTGQVYHSSGDAVTYGEVGTLIAERMKIYVVEGIVKETAYATMTGKYTSEGQMVVGTTRVQIDSYEMTEHFGRYVECYINEDGDVLAIRRMRLDDEVTFEAEDIVKLSNSSLIYDNGKNTKTINFSAPIIIYNGRNIEGNQYDPSLFNIDEGSVTLIKSARSSYDVMIIKSIKNIVIGAIDNDVHEIFDKFNSAEKVIIDTEDEESHSIVDLNGDKYTTDDLATEMILSVEESLDGKCVKAVLSKKTVTGTLQEINEDEVKLNDVVYEINASLLRNITLKLGTYYKFYINADEKIVAVDVSGMYQTKGFLIAVACKGGLDKQVLVKLINPECDLSTSQKSIVLECASKVTVDGTSRLEGEEIVNALKTNGTFEQIPIIYTVNSKGQVNKIDTPYYNSGKENPESLQKIYDCVESGTTLFSVSMSSLGYGYTFGGKYFSNKNAMMLKPDKNNQYGDDVEDVSTIAAGSYTVRLYSAEGSESKFADFVIFDRDAVVNYQLTVIPYVVIEKINAINEEHENIVKLTLSNGETTNEYTVRENYLDIVNGVNEGDIIRISADKSMELKRILKLIDYETKSPVSNLMTSTFAANSEFRPLFGDVEGVEQNCILLHPFGGDLEIHPIRNGRTFVYSNERGRITMEPIDAINIHPKQYYDGENCDKVFINTVNCTVGYCFIIR